MRCEFCNCDIEKGKEYRVFGKDSQGVIVKIHIYCEPCFLELIPAYEKWKNSG